MGDKNYNYEDLFELSPDLFCIVSFDGFFKKVNSSVVNLLGYDTAELYARPVNSFVHPDDVKQTTEARASLTKGKFIKNFENKYLTKNGDTVWLSWTAKACPENKIIFAVAKDITEKKRIDLQVNDHITELTTANEKYKNLSYTTAHDLRPPIDNLISIINLIQTDIEANTKVNKLFKLLEQAVLKLKSSINSYIEDLKHTNLTQVEIESIDFKDCWTETLFSIRNMIGSSKAVVKTNFEKAPSVNFNTDYLQSIFLNMVSNAVKYAQPNTKPEIFIYSFKEGETTKLVFEDKGLGMDMKSVKDKLFGLHQTFHKNNDSKGIGLYLVHTHVTSLGGSINVESKPNKGSKFTISFSNKLEVSA